MSILEIRLFGDPVLRQEAREVTDFDERLRRLAADMFDTMRAAPGVGLAANQVGVLKRLFTWEVVDVHEDEDAESGEQATVRGHAVVNPVVEDASEESLLDEEGCLSFPGLFYPVERPLRARMRWQDLDGEEHRSDVEGFDARVWLHELDHLNGIVFIDHLAKHDRKEAMSRMREYRLSQGTDEPRPAGGLLLGRKRL
ncbi:MAG TPA: peptide deformylase [Nitriliruptorales bacterium]